MMENYLQNGYVLKAMDSYPYNQEDTLEALNYALSYNDTDARALYLMGRLYAEQLGDYKTAAHYYAEAVAQDMDLTQTYPYYAYALIWNTDYAEAQKLIDFAISIKGIDKAWMLQIQGVLYERQEQLDEAIKAYKRAKNMAINNNFIEFTEMDIKRVKSKQKPDKKDKAKKKRKTKKKED